MSQDFDPAFLDALLAADADELERMVSSLPADAIQPLLGMLGSVTSDEMPESPLAQALELDEAYRVVPHLSLLSDRLALANADRERGISRKVLVAMPPRHGKTEMISVYLPLWLLRRDHRLKIGIISHSPNLAATWGRRVRRMVERHGAQLGLSIAPDAGAVSEWETPEGGGVTSRSIGQALAGVGFNILIIDDPTRDFAAAHSAAARQSVWEWYTANATTRLEPPSLIIVVQTRWHEDDLTGRLLSPEHEGDPGEWERIILPALASHDPAKGETDPLGRAPGEPLLSPLVANETPEQALARFDQLRRDIGSYAWASLFQQSPAPAEGAIFNVGWWRYWTLDPSKVTGDGRVVLLDPDALRGGRVLDSWDAAFKGSSSSDFVVGQRWARIGPDRFLLAQSRGRRSFTETISEMLDFFERGLGANLSHQHLVEDKANGPAIIDVMRKKISGLKPVEPRGSKEARARSVTPEVESGNVYLPLPPADGARGEYAWVHDFLAEARSFPTGEHDDQVDAMTQALDELREDGAGAISRPTQPSAGNAMSRRLTQRTATRGIGSGSGSRRLG